MYSKCRKGFTLIELLVVISIIAVLMSVMMPALGKAREQAKLVVDKANLKQITLGALLWAEDNDNWAVGASWFNNNRNIGTSLTPYLNADYKGENDVFVCPSAKKEDFFLWDDTGVGAEEQRQNKLTYGVNGWMAVYSEERGKPASPGMTGRPCPDGPKWQGPDAVYSNEHGVTRINSVRKPGETVYFCEVAYWAATSNCFNPLLPADRLPFAKTYGKPVAARWHNKGCTSNDYGFGNIAWVDGHVSKEPDDFDELPLAGKNARWQYYFWDH